MHLERFEQRDITPSSPPEEQHFMTTARISNPGFGCYVHEESCLGETWGDIDPKSRLQAQT